MFQKSKDEKINNSQENDDFDLFNYKINKYKNLDNNNIRNKLYNSNDNIVKSSALNKLKKDFYEFNPKPDVEEIPTFTLENDRNIDNYKGYIYNKQTLIEQNSKNYISYMQKYEKRKNQISTPYEVFQEITKKNLNNYNNNNANSNINYNNNKNIINNDNAVHNNNEWNENFSNNYLHQNNDNNKEKKTLTSMSAKTLLFNNRKSEITNPELFYKRNNNDYFKYRAEQKKYLDYNYRILMNRNKLHDKKEPNINPFNPKDEDFEHYKSDLPHNPILNPVNYYSYNKYLEKEILKSNNNVQNNNNISNHNVNNENKRNYSPFHNAGNQVFKK